MNNDPQSQSSRICAADCPAALVPEIDSIRELIAKLETAHRLAENECKVAIATDSGPLWATASLEEQQLMNALRTMRKRLARLTTSEVVE